MYPAGSGRVRCYGLCLDKAERLLELSIKDKTITADEAELLRELIGGCRVNVGKVEGLRDYCTNKYEELRKARSEEQARAGAPTTQETKGKLTECYDNCIKYYGDNQVALQTCYSICNALWKPTPQLDLDRFSKCFPQGVMELEEFMERYRRSSIGYDDQQIVTETASVVSRMLEEGKKSGCPDLENTIVKVVSNALDGLGIDRYSIRKAYGHGIPEEVRKILKKIFPNIEWEEGRPTPVHISESRSQRRKEKQPEYSHVSYRKYKPRVSLRRRSFGVGEWAGHAVAVVLVILSMLAWSYAIAHPAVLPAVTAFLLAIAALAVKPSWYTGLWFSILFFSIPLMLRLVSITHPSIPINSNWVSQFISIVNQYRVSENATPLQYCPALSQFAQMRFNTMVTNPAISHYGYEEDYNKFFSQYQGYTILITSEEVLFPSGYTPSQYVQFMINNAPIHWQGLMDQAYTYYGYYIGYGPSYIVIGSCPSTEIPGPGINITQYYDSQGCSYELVNTTWLVLELSNWCPSS